MGEPKVIYEEEDFLALFKPAGLLMHPFRIGTAKGRVIIDEPTLTDWLKVHYPETANVGDNPKMRPGLVHRLDRETSGLLIVARNQSAFHYFKNLFQTGGIKKNYLALVSGSLKTKQGVIEKPISLKPGTVKRTVHGGKMTKEAITQYEVIEEMGGRYSLLRIFPRTGRTHQIRVHLASIGHPIIGDTIYGRGKRQKEDGLVPERLMLHAFSLSFVSPSGRFMDIECPPGNDFIDCLSRFRSYPH